jgi:hypothetical protein
MLRPAGRLAMTFVPIPSLRPATTQGHPGI